MLFTRLFSFALVTLFVAGDDVVPDNKSDKCKLLYNFKFHSFSYSLYFNQIKFDFCFFFFFYFITIINS